MEADVPRVGRIVRNERRRPEPAGGTGTIEIRVVQATGGGKEDAVAIGGGNYSSIYACSVIVCCPSPGSLCL